MDPNNNLDLNKHLPIDESIRLSNELFDELLETNSLKTIDELSHKSLFHSYLKVVLTFIIAMSSMSQADAENAKKSAQELAKLSHKYRRHGFMTSAMKMIKTPNYDKYTDLEMHAEFFHTVQFALNAVIPFVLDTNYTIIGLIRFAYYSHKFYRNIHECQNMMKLKTDWESESARLNYEAGVKLMLGGLHISVSNTPPKILKLMNLFGLNGNENMALGELKEAAINAPGIHSRLTKIFLQIYWLYWKPMAGLGVTDVTMSTELVRNEQARFPKSVLYRGFGAKLEQISGRIDKSIESFNSLLNNNYQPIHKWFQMELIFCYALKCEWNECIILAQLLQKDPGHLLATAVYMEAVFCYVTASDECEEHESEKVKQLFETITTLRIRHLGKTMTAEKIMVVIADRFAKHNYLLVLPELEFLYNWNILSLASGQESILKGLMARVDKQIDKYRDDIVKSDYLDNYLTALFFKGVIHKLLGNYSEANECFHYILKEEARIEHMFSIPPQAVLELGLTELAQHNYEEAKQWLNKCIADYSRYTNENYVHLKAYAGLRLMGVNTTEQKADESKMEDYRKEWLKDMNISENKYEDIIKAEEQNGNQLYSDEK